MDKSHVGLELCFYCQKPKSIILDRRLRNTLPHEAVYNREPCDECAGWMKQGVILISVREGESGDNPYRTGGWCVVRDEALERIFPPGLFAEIQRRRVCFVSDDAWDRLGFPRTEPEE